jgi:hypothetical protein
MHGQTCFVNRHDNLASSHTSFLRRRDSHLETEHVGRLPEQTAGIEASPVDFLSMESSHHGPKASA